MRCLFLTVVALLTLIAETGSAAVTILPFGDSITAGGGKGASSYRHFLFEQLQREGLPCAFIGPNRDQRGLAHAGYSGWNSRRLRDITAKIYRAHPADIVLLHSGHNNFAKDRPIAGIIEDTRTIIETIMGIKPSAQILLAQVIPAGKLPKYSYIPELNREIARLAAELRQRQRPITLVDLATGFDWRTDTTADKVHPNAQGARKMAEKWYLSIKPLLEKR